MSPQTRAQHIDLHHKDFKKLCLANFLFAVSSYMILPLLLLWTDDTIELSQCQRSSVMMSFGIGVFSLGAFCSYLIQRYRRNLVCLMSMLLFAVCILAFGYYDQELLHELSPKGSWLFVVVVRFLSGASFGLAYMVLNSTLIVDCCESSRRTRANVISMWFYRLAVVVGPLLGCLMYREMGFLNSLYFSLAVSVVPVGMLSSVQFPFKAPDETVCVVSSDRFFSLRSYPLVGMTIALSASLGILLAMSVLALCQLVSLVVGFLAALLVSFLLPTIVARPISVYLGFALCMVGLVCVWSAVLFVACLGCLMMGIGVALVLQSLQVLLINVGDHCQRGTSQSTYILSSEFGIAIGYSCVAIHGEAMRNSVVVELASFLLFALLIYIFAQMFWIKKNLRKV